jgi:hypothetical protein
VPGRRRPRQTRNGTEVQLHDQMAALENVARHLGMFNASLKRKDDKENPIEVLIRSVQGTSIKPVAYIMLVPAPGRESAA